jgi:hypothetical protein
MNKDRRRFLKILGIIGAGLLAGVPKLSLGDSSVKPSVPDTPVSLPPGGRFNSPRGGCTDFGITLLEKGPWSGRCFVDIV